MKGHMQTMAELSPDLWLPENQNPHPARLLPQPLKGREPQPSTPYYRSRQECMSKTTFLQNVFLLTFPLALYLALPLGHTCIIVKHQNNICGGLWLVPADPH